MPSAPRRSFIAARDPLRGDEDGPQFVSLDLEQIPHMPAGDDERMAGGRRSDVHERDRALVLVNDLAGELPRDDLAEDAVWIAHCAPAAYRSPCGGWVTSSRARSIACSELVISPAKLASSSSARIRPSSGPGVSPS